MGKDLKRKVAKEEKEVAKEEKEVKNTERDASPWTRSRAQGGGPVRLLLWIRRRRPGKDKDPATGTKEKVTPKFQIGVRRQFAVRV